MSSEKTLLLIDSYALIYRAYYAFPPTLTAGDGTPINSVYGFASLMLDVLLKFKPSHVVAVMDSDKPTIRSQDFVEYKANRKETPSDFIVQIPKVIELLERFKIPILKVDGYEADDVIATIDHNHSGKWAKTIIVTGDRDLFQLVDDDTFVYLAGSSFSQSKLFDATMVKEKMGVTPEQIPDYKGLSGDASDNIPGVAGIGPKSTVDLISQFGSLENIYTNIDKVIPKYQKKLQESFEIATLSKSLATVVREVPLSFKIEESIFPLFNLSEVKSLFEEFKFKSLASKLSTLSSHFEMPNTFEEELYAEELLGSVIWDPKIKPKVNEIFLYSTFNEGLNPFETSFASIKMLFDNTVHVVELTNLAIFEKLSDFLKGLRVFTADLKKVRNTFLNFGLVIDLQNAEDILIMGVLGSNGQSSYSIKSLAAHYQVGISQNEVSYLMALPKLLEKINLTENQSNLYKLEKEVTNVVISMERQGIGFDRESLERDRILIITNIEKLREEIYKEVGHEFNINSPKQLSSILYDERGLKLNKKTKSGGGSTNEAALNQMKNLDPLINLILKYRESEKIRSTYLDTLAAYIYPKTRKIHATFDQLGAVSGRFSSKNPNMQNLPTNEVNGINIRNLFIATSNSFFIGFDYSQQELRILAALAKEAVMLDAFNNKKDIHKITASELFGIDLESVTKEQRGVGKTINFSVIYGISAFALSERLQIERSLAAEFINKYYRKYPNIKKFMEETIAMARSNGYTETIMGRRRSEVNINSNNMMLRSASERELFNFVIQGSAADLMKLAMVKLESLSAKFKANLLLQVHDEFLFEINKSEDINIFAKSVKDIMLGVKDIGVTFDVNVNYGEKWGSMSELI